MKYSHVIAIHYTVYGVPICHDTENGMARIRYDSARTDEDIISACKKLYRDFCDRYPISEYPKRYFRITGVDREYIIPLPSFNKIIQGETDADNS